MSPVFTRSWVNKIDFGNGNILENKKATLHEM